MENCNDYHCFDSTHLGKSFRTWERHFSIALLWPHPESHPNARRVIHPRCVRCRQRSNLQGQPRFITRPLLGLSPRACGLVRERFTQHLRCERPFHESWHNCVHEATQSARNYSGRVFPQHLKALGYRPSDTHCSKLVRFIGMIRGSNPSLASTGRSMKHI